MKKLTLAAKRITASHRMVWIPDPPEILRKKLKRNFRFLFFKYSANSLRLTPYWNHVI